MDSWVPKCSWFLEWWVCFYYNLICKRVWSIVLLSNECLRITVYFFWLLTMLFLKKISLLLLFLFVCLTMCFSLFPAVWPCMFDYFLLFDHICLTISCWLTMFIWLFPVVWTCMFDYFLLFDHICLTISGCLTMFNWLFPAVWPCVFDYFLLFDHVYLTISCSLTMYIWLFPAVWPCVLGYFLLFDHVYLTISCCLTMYIWLFSVGWVTYVCHGDVGVSTSLWGFQSRAAVLCENPILDHTERCHLFPILAIVWWNLFGGNWQSVTFL